MKNKIVWLLAIFLVISIITISLFLNSKQSLSINELFINNISISDNELTVDGGLLSSGSSYRDYKYNISGNEMHITFNGGLVTNKHPYGDFKFSIKDRKLQEVDVIYLKHKDTLTKIYPD